MPEAGGSWPGGPPLSVEECNVDALFVGSPAMPELGSGSRAGYMAGGTDTVLSVVGACWDTEGGAEGCLDGVDHGITKSASGSRIWPAGCVVFVSVGITGFMDSSAAFLTKGTCAAGVGLGLAKLAAMSSADTSKTASLGFVSAECVPPEARAGLVVIPAAAPPSTDGGPVSSCIFVSVPTGAEPDRVAEGVLGNNRGASDANASGAETDVVAAASKVAAAGCSQL